MKTKTKQTTTTKKYIKNKKRTLNFSSRKEKAENSTQPMWISIEKQPHEVINKYNNKLHLK